MKESFKGGKIVVTDRTIQINGIFGNGTTIQKHEIEGINAVGNMFVGILSIAMVIGAYRGFKMLTGNKYVTIKRSFGDDVNFWMPSSEVKAFRSSI